MKRDCQSARTTLNHPPMTSLPADTTYYHTII